MDRRVPGHQVLLATLMFSIVSTALHYAHNYVEVDRYPQPSVISSTMTRAAILISWPVLTTVGIAGYLLYVRARHWAARACLLIYSLTGLVTLGHFLVGVPDVPWLWFTTLFTDALAGLALWAFAVWSAVALRPRMA